MSMPTTIRLTIDEGPKKGETLARTPGGGAIRIGRVVRGNTIAIRDPSISQKHLSVDFDPDISRWTVTDLGTSNATSVNGVRVVPAVPFPLSDGDSVKIGGSTLISVRIEDVGEEVSEGSRRIGRNRGRRGGPVRVSVVDDRIERPKRGKTVGVDETGYADELGRGRRRNSSRVLKKDEISDPVCVEDELGKRRRQNSSRVLKKDEILDSVREEDGTDAIVKLQRGRKGNCSRALKVDEDLSTLVVSNEETVKVERRRRKRGKSDSASKEDQVSDTVVIEHQIEVQDKDVDPILVEDVAVAETRKKLPRVRRGNSSRVSKTNEAMDIQTVDTVVADSSEAQESLGRERRGILAKVSQKGEALVPRVEVSIDVPKILPRGRRGNSSRVLKTNETMDTFVKESSELQENIGRGRRGILSEVSQKREASVLAVEGSTDVPKNLGRGRRRSTRTQVLKKDEILDSVAEENIERPKALRRGRTSSNMGLKQENVLDFVADSSTQVPKKVGRTRRTGSNKVLKDDEVSDSIVGESVKVPQDLKRGSRIGSSRVSKKNEILDSGMEDRTEDPVNLGRGKKRACSTRVSKKDNLVDLVEESIRIPEVGEGRPRRAPARRTRAASARLSMKERLLESAPLNLKGPIIENIYHHKELSGDSNQLGQSEKIQLVSLATSSPKEFNRSKHRKEFNKENHSLVKSQRRENEELMMRSSCSKQIPDDEGPSSVSVANVAEPSHVLPKVWNGNGIPNTTSKYKEDSKVSFHATPFEERLEKALSGDKHVTQRS